MQARDHLGEPSLPSDYLSLLLLLLLLLVLLLLLLTTYYLLLLQVGDHFGELSLLEPGAAPKASVYAGPGTRVGLICPAAFEEVCSADVQCRGVVQRHSRAWAQMYAT